MVKLIPDVARGSGSSVSRRRLGLASNALEKSHMCGRVELPKK